jgi:hypothetical protein
MNIICLCDVTLSVYPHPGRLEKYAWPRLDSNLRPLEYILFTWVHYTNTANIMNIIVYKQSSNIEMYLQTFLRSSQSISELGNVIGKFATNLTWNREKWLEIDNNFRHKFKSLITVNCGVIEIQLFQGTSKNIFGVTNPAKRFLGGMGECSPRTFLKFGSLKWHLQHSESTFCKKFQVFKTI